MDLIKLFLLAATGYLLLGLFDAAQIKRLWIVPLLGVSGALMTALPYLFIALFFKSGRSGLSFSILLALAAAAGLATLYIALLEIPLRHRQAGSVYRRGTYARTRHPGFLAHLAFNLFFALTFASQPIALFCFGCIACNLALVTVEDRLFFPLLFNDWDDYTLTTGFILPRRRGLL